MITEKIQKQIGEAMKAHDSLRVSTLRLLSSAFNYEKIEVRHDLTDDEALTVIRKQAKQRRDSIEAYKKAGSEERVKQEEAELKILQEFLPPEMSDSDLEKLVDQAIIAVGAKTMAEMGMVIGKVKTIAPTIEGGKVAALVKQKLG